MSLRVARCVLVLGRRCCALWVVVCCCVLFVDCGCSLFVVVCLVFLGVCRAWLVLLVSIYPWAVCVVRCSLVHVS